MGNKLLYCFYLLSLVFASISCIYRYKQLDVPSKILAVMVCCAFVNECVAYFAAQHYHTNLPVYTIYCLVEFGILCLYFNNVIDVFVKKRVGIYIGAVGILLGILNMTFIQNMNVLNSYFLFFEGLSVIALSLFAFFRFLLKYDSLYLYKYHHFWFISILIFFWSITFLTWGLYDFINTTLEHDAWKINFALMIIGTITYGGFGCIFLLYNKMHNYK